MLCVGRVHVHADPAHLESNMGSSSDNGLTMGPDEFMFFKLS